jgi:hypothetical protein
MVNVVSKQRQKEIIAYRERMNDSQKSWWDKKPSGRQPDLLYLTARTELVLYERKTGVKDRRLLRDLSSTPYLSLHSFTDQPFIPGIKNTYRR